MSEVFTEITLVNSGDKAMFERGLIGENEIRKLTVNALVDTGAWPLVINEEVRRKLGLQIRDSDTVTVAGGDKKTCNITELVTMCWQDRETSDNAVVLDGEEDVLLGAYPLEGLDLMIHPKLQKVTGAHGDKIRYVVK